MRSTQLRLAAWEPYQHPPEDGETCVEVAGRMTFLLQQQSIFPWAVHHDCCRRDPEKRQRLTLPVG
jgi:hypothetical protein